MGMVKAAHPGAGEITGTVLGDALPGALARDAILVVAFVLAIGLGAQIAVHLPSTPVPVTGQTLAVLLGGVVLGPTRAIVGSLLYLAGGLAGLPLLAAASTASLGYVIGFVVAAALVGTLAAHGWDRGTVRLIVVMAIGNVAIYAVGVAWLMAYLHVDLARGFVLGVQPFLVGDVVKIGLALALVPSAWWLVRLRH